MISCRYLIPEDFRFQQFQQVIRNRLQLNKEQTLYIFFKNNKLYSNGKGNNGLLFGG